METASARRPAFNVLIVEDDEDLRELMCSALEMHGYSVITAHDGADALSKLHSSGPPSLIILDLFMPGMNGWEFCDKARQRRELEDVPIVVHSSASQPIPPGATKALQKPLSFERLLSLVNEYCAA